MTTVSARDLQAGREAEAQRPTVLLSICDIRSATVLDGFNVGNKLFVHACARHLNYDLEINDLAIRPRIGKLLLPFPNLVREDEELVWLKEYIEATDAQSVVLLCGGIQADERRKLKVPAKGVETLKIISERSALLGVRGQFTAEVLEDHGIRNVEVIGCPSMHWWMDPSFRVAAPSGTPDTADGGVVHATPDGNFASEIGELYAFGEENDLAYVLQSEFYFADLLRAKALPDAQKHLDWVLANFRPADVSVDALRAWIAGRAYHFGDVPRWIEFLRARGFSIGNRLHGSIAAILAGRPARILWHDERVREVADYFRIPATPFRGQTRGGMRELVPGHADMESFNRHYGETLETYVRFLRKNNLSLNPQLDACVPDEASTGVGDTTSPKEG